MFRAIVYSIVLTLVASPSATVVCRAWCVPQAATVCVRYHTTPAAPTGVVAHDSCDGVWLGAAAFVREDVSGASSPDRAVLIPGFRHTIAAIQERRQQHSLQECWLKIRSLLTALRL